MDRFTLNTRFSRLLVNDRAALETSASAIDRNNAPDVKRCGLADRLSGDAAAMSSRYGLSIRTANSGDVDGLAELLAAAGETVARDRLASRLNAVLDQPGALLIADEWGPPSGLIVVHWHAVLTADLKVGWISALLVDPARRRNGVARLLLKAASQAARSAGCGELVLTSPAGPSDLRAFGLATGFVETGERLTRPLRKRG
jgi:GNAT superfamily N-acetyltransferase